MRVATLLLLALALSACAPIAPSTVQSQPATPTLTESPTPTPTPEYLGPVAPVGEAVSVASDLQIPWSVVRLQSGSSLISERDRGLVRELSADGELRDVAVIPGVVAGAEGGLLGLAVLDEIWLYAYFTTATDNRIVRFRLEGEAGSYHLGEHQEILTGIVKGTAHNGGRIAFGPDRMLYATVGDARDYALPQDLTSLNGKILRMTPLGLVPYDNPFNSLVYSYGHRNPQGITWDDDGQLWSSELGQNTWDELNRIDAGANYGWPVVEGMGGVEGYVDPVAVWPTDDASPSALTYSRGTFFMAALRGQRLWVIQIDGSTVTSTPYFVGVYGRIRCVIPGPDGTLWFTTSNWDANGTPSPGDDHLWQLRLDVLPEG